MAYCPKCFGDNLKLAKRGVIHLSINKKQMQSGQLLFNILKDGKDDLKRMITEKVEEFMKWYSTFQNKDPIRSVQLSSSDFTCDNGCPVNVTTRYSVVNIIISQNELLDIVKKNAEKFNLRVEVDSEQEF